MIAPGADRPVAADVATHAVRPPAPAEAVTTVALAPAPRENLDSRASMRFDLFLFSAAATVLITRTYLEATGYPQVGGKLHIAHVLWGGLLLGAAVLILLVALGSAVKFWASLIGGVGFGLFIDEVGKFLTKDVDYFFKPAIAIIYAVFISAYVIGRELLARRRPTPARIEAIAAQAVADHALGQLTDRRRDAVRQLLAKHTDTPSAGLLSQLLDGPDRPRRAGIEEWFAAVGRWWQRVVVAAARRRWVRGIVWTILIVQSASALLTSALLVWGVIADDDIASISTGEIINFIGSIVQALLITIGLVLIRRKHRLAGLRTIRAGLFITLTFTLVIEFGEEQLGALVSFGIVSVMYLVIGALSRIELPERVSRRQRRQQRRAVMTPLPAE
jgi:hypothetical protein